VRGEVGVTVYTGGRV